MAENEDKIVLTLGDEQAFVEETAEEVKAVEEERDLASVNASDVVGYAKLDDSSLSAEEKKMVEDFSKQIDITETNSILQYGATAQNKVADFSDTALKNVKTKDIDDVGDTLLKLVSQLRNFDVDGKDDNFFAKLFGLLIIRVCLIKFRKIFCGNILSRRHFNNIQVIASLFCGFVDFLHLFF